MYTSSKHLLPGCTRPTDESLELFYNKVRESLPNMDLPENFQVRWIGADAESTQSILQHIRSGKK